MIKLIDALNYLKVSELSYTEWITVGMALRNEGYPYKMWDVWSRSDKRYHDGECKEKWETFKDCANPVKGGTIIQMASDRGWKYVERDQGIRDGNATAWRLESSLREFPNITPVNFWFEYPVHRVDGSGELEEAYAEGSAKGNLAKNRKNTTAEERKESIEAAYNACTISPPVTIDSIAEYLAVTPRCVRDRLKELPDRFWVKNGIVGRTEK